MPKLTKARAFKIVYDELSKVDMFMGKFDAKNGNDKFMSGVQTVMEAIAYGVSEDMQCAYTDIFLANWLNSKEKAEHSGTPCDGCEYSEPYKEYRCVRYPCKYENEPQTDVYEYHNGEWVKPDCPWR